MNRVLACVAVFAVGCGGPVKSLCADTGDGGLPPVGSMRVTGPTRQTGQTLSLTALGPYQCKLVGNSVQCKNNLSPIGDFGFQTPRTIAEGVVFTAADRVSGGVVDTLYDVSIDTTDGNATLRLTIVRMPTASVPGEVRIDGSACVINGSPATITANNITAPLVDLR